MYLGPSEEIPETYQGGCTHFWWGVPFTQALGFDRDSVETHCEHFVHFRVSSKLHARWQACGADEPANASPTALKRSNEQWSNSSCFQKEISNHIPVTKASGCRGRTSCRERFDEAIAFASLSQIENLKFVPAKTGLPFEASRSFRNPFVS